MASRICAIAAVVALVVGGGCDLEESSDDPIVVEEDGDAGGGADDTGGGGGGWDDVAEPSGPPRGTPASACPSGRYTAKEAFEGEGLCLPQRPKGTPAEKCPSGRFLHKEVFRGEGLCAPAPPEQPSGGCPEGWSASPAVVDREGNVGGPDGEGVAEICTPPTPSSSCPDGEMPRLGESGCVQHGTACPSGADGWLEPKKIRDVAGQFRGDIRYVDADAGSGGDGSRAAPYATIQAAIDAAGRNDIVAPAPGTYEERIELEGSIALVGSCVAETRIAPSDPEAIGAIVSVARVRRGHLANLTVSGPASGVRIASEVRDYRLSDLRIDGALGSGLGINADVVARRLVVAGTRAEANKGGSGVGIDVTAPGKLDLEASVVQGNRSVGIAVKQRGELTARQVVVRKTRKLKVSEVEGYGLEVTTGGDATLRRVRIADNHSAGIWVNGPRSTVDLRHAVVPGTLAPAETGWYGFGLAAVGGSQMDARYVLLDRNRSAGALARGSAEMRLRDSVVRRTRPQTSDPKRGAGVIALSGAGVDLERTVVSHNRQTGVRVDGGETSVTIADGLVHRTHARKTDGKRGDGMLVTRGAEATGRRLHLIGNRATGATVGTPEASLTLRDAAVRGTRPRKHDGRLGRGLLVAAEGSATWERGLVDGVGNFGAGAGGEGTTMELRDLVVRGPSGSGGASYSTGVQVQGGAVATVRRAAVLDGWRVGVTSLGSGTTVEATDLRVRGMQPTAAGFGVGLVLQGGGEARETRRVRLQNNVGIGLLTFSKSRPGRLRDLIVEGTRAGDGAIADGIYALGSEPLTVGRGLIRNNARNGVVVSRARADFLDVRIENNTAGIVREGESSVESARTHVTDNQRANRTCRRQCYEGDERPSELDLEEAL